MNIALEALPKHCPWKKILEAEGNKLPSERLGKIPDKASEATLNRTALRAALATRLLVLQTEYAPPPASAAPCRCGGGSAVPKGPEQLAAEGRPCRGLSRAGMDLPFVLMLP